jgi:hypothetical protein
LDNQATESSSGPLDTIEAGDAFASMLDPVEDEKKDDTPELPALDAPVEGVEEGADAPAEDDATVTVKIDGKDVEVKLSELKQGYQRQLDYTRKTMEVSETRKAAEAETAKARSERDNYAQNLNRFQAQLEGQQQEHQKVDMEALLNSDPVEYLRQTHLANTRQAQLQQVYTERQRVGQQQQAEAQEAQSRHLQSQQQELLAKLPEWRDAAKADADRAAIRDYLVHEGYEPQSLSQITDARAVVLARKAMLYDKVVAKASAAAKKVASLPTRMERPGVSEQGLDRRTSAYQRLSKSGSLNDAADIFASLL